MNNIDVYISAEDLVTKAVIERLLAFCSSRFSVFKEIPARGGEVKKKIKELNKLAQTKPVILLTDLDVEDCAPILKQKLLNGDIQSADFLINIAIDEAEAWLMADRDGFASYLSVPVNQIPSSKLQKLGGMKPVNEMDFSCKSSYQLTHVIAPESSDSNLKQQISVTGVAAKGKEYNSAILPFIKDKWDITVAMQNSDSLSRMVNRLKDLEKRIP